MGLFARKPETAPEAPAPATRSRKGLLTCGELNDAIAAVCAEIVADCTARKTLEALYTLTDNIADGDIVTLSGPAPVTVAELDEALTQVEQLGPLKRVRSLLAQAEEQAARVVGEPVTRAEFDALVNAVAIVVSNVDAANNRPGQVDGRLGYRLERDLKASDAFSSNEQRSMLQRIMDLAEVASKNADMRERNQSRRRAGQPWSR
jgi:hypothetical protein